MTEVQWVQGNDAMSLMIDIWLDGFISGAASAAATCLPEADTDVVDAFADRMTAATRNDPLAVETIRQEITERLTGTDSGTKAFKIREQKP